MIKEALIKTLLGKGDIAIPYPCPKCNKETLVSRFENGNVLIVCSKCGEIGKKAFKGVF